MENTAKEKGEGAADPAPATAAEDEGAVAEGGGKKAARGKRAGQVEAEEVQQEEVVLSANNIVERGKQFGVHRILRLDYSLT